MTSIIGLSTMTESSAVYIEDGEVSIGIEEERLTRKKHQGGIPYNSIQYILQKKNKSLHDIDILAIYWNPYNIIGRLLNLATISILHPNLIRNKINRTFEVLGGEKEIDSGWMDIFFIKKRLLKKFRSLPKKIEFFDHHLSHMASAVFSTDFEDTNILVMDGAGETDATTIGYYNEEKFTKIKKIKLPHSLGHYYSAFTGFLGFKMLDGEYKLMGLAPYGEPVYTNWIKNNLIHIEENSYKLKYQNLDYHDALKNKFSKLLLDKFKSANKDTYGKIEKKYLDLSSSVQSVFEEIVINLAHSAKKNHNSNKLCIVGGCGLNCKSNGKILEKNIFDEIYVPPVPNDAGGSLGAAYLAYNKTYLKKPKKIQNAFLGYQIKDDLIIRCAKNFKLHIEKIPENTITKIAAKKISEGNIIAWVQGKMEFGPRALGNRSFLADPRNEVIIEELNVKIKKREMFRPFAPSVLTEFKSEYFDLQQESEFMSFIVNVKENKRTLIPAVTHYDKTARPQTVKKESNLKYWNLINEFYKITNIPVLLNTSFNIDEPIACTELDCFNTFTNSKINYMFIGDYLVKK